MEIQRPSNKQLQQQLLMQQMRDGGIDPSTIQPQVTRKREHWETVPNDHESIGEDIRYLHNAGSEQDRLIARDYLRQHNVTKLRKGLDYPSQPSRLVVFHHGGQTGPEHRLSSATLPLPQPYVLEQPIRFTPLKEQKGMLTRPTTNEFGELIAPPTSRLLHDSEALPLFNISGETYHEPLFSGFPGLDPNNRIQQVIVALFHFNPAVLHDVPAKALLLRGRKVTKGMLELVVKSFYLIMSQSQTEEYRNKLRKAASIDVESIMERGKTMHGQVRNVLSNPVTLLFNHNGMTVTRTVMFMGISAALSAAAVYGLFYSESNVGQYLINKLAPYLTQDSYITSAYRSVIGMVLGDDHATFTPPPSMVNLFLSLSISSLLVGFSDRMAVSLEKSYEEVFGALHNSKVSDRSKHMLGTLYSKIEQTGSAAMHDMNSLVDKAKDTQRGFVKNVQDLVKSVFRHIGNLIQMFFQLGQMLISAGANFVGLYQFVQRGNQEAAKTYTDKVAVKTSSTTMTLLKYIGSVTGVTSAVNNMRSGGGAADVANVASEVSKAADSGKKIGDLPSDVVNIGNDVSEVAEANKTYKLKKDVLDLSNVFLSSSYTTGFANAGLFFLMAYRINKVLAYTFPGSTDQSTRLITSLYSNAILPYEGLLHNAFTGQRSEGMALCLDTLTSIIEVPGLLQGFETPDLIATHNGVPQPSVTDSKVKVHQYHNIREALYKEIMTRQKMSMVNDQDMTTDVEMPPDAVFQLVKAHLSDAEPTSDNLLQQMNALFMGLSPNARIVLGEMIHVLQVVPPKKFVLYCRQATSLDQFLEFGAFGIDNNGDVKEGDGDDDDGSDVKTIEPLTGFEPQTLQNLTALYGSDVNVTDHAPITYDFLVEHFAYEYTSMDELLTKYSHHHDVSYEYAVVALLLFCHYHKVNADFIKVNTLPQAMVRLVKYLQNYLAYTITKEDYNATVKRIPSYNSMTLSQVVGQYLVSMLEGVILTGTPYHKSVIDEVSVLPRITISYLMYIQISPNIHHRFTRHTPT